MAKIAFDTGGTFTDFAFEDDDGRVRLHKVLSTPHNPAEAVIRGVSELIEASDEPLDRSRLRVFGATTVVTNALLERKGVKSAFITTAGFRDMLRIRNEGRYDLYDLQIRFPAPLVPRDLCFGVRERVAADGTVVTPLDEADVVRIAALLEKAGVDSVGVCLLHAYKYGAHERQIAKILGSLAPHLSVSLSSVVCPEVREFDRASTTVVNAYTRPIMTAHVAHLEQEFRRLGLDERMLWITSSGGVVPSRHAASTPVRLIESGPAAGAVAAAEYARLSGQRNVLSFDMGGTTAKLCLIANGAPSVGTDLEVAHQERFRKGSGFPLKIQSIQMIEIGAGGGSIAHRTPLGLLDVGPRSAGAAPGPAAYGRGGTEPTVTDADILLGYMGVGSFVGGSFHVDRDLAAAAMQGLARELDVPVERCAWGIHDLVNETMSKAAAMHASDHGVDPRALPLIAFGGAGPVHAYAVARKLGIGTVICPVGAGVTSAVGLLIAPVAVDLSGSLPMAATAWDHAAMHNLLSSLSDQGGEVVRSAGIAPDDITFSYSVDMRHVGQGHEVNVSVPDLSMPPEPFKEALLAGFYARYRELFGRTVGGSDVEAVTWRVRTSGPNGQITRPQVRGDLRDEALKAHRPVFFEEAGWFVDTPVYDYYSIRSGIEIRGPAIFEQQESTIVMGPSGTLHVDACGNAVMKIV